MRAGCTGSVRFAVMTSTPAQTTAVIADRPEVAEGGCDTCPHPVAAHDAISLRFCSATRAAALTRGCVCPA
jgi:hypothetical protein